MYLSKRNLFVNTIYIAIIGLFNFNFFPLNASEYKKDPKQSKSRERSIGFPQTDKIQSIRGSKALKCCLL